MIKMMKPRIAVLDTRRIKPATKRTASIYSSAEWQEFRAAVIAERGRHCELCGKAGRKIYVDHIKELRDGGKAFDKANVQILCASHHTEKTLAERTRRMGEIPDGDAV